MNHLTYLVTNLSFMQGMAITLALATTAMFILVCISHNIINTQARRLRHARVSIDWWRRRLDTEAETHHMTYAGDLEELQLLLDTSNEHSAMQAQHIEKMESEASDNAFVTSLHELPPLPLDFPVLGKDEL